MFADIYEKEVDDLIHQMVYGCNLPESSRHEDNEMLKSKHTNKIDAKTAAKIAARDAKARKAKNKCMPCFSHTGHFFQNEAYFFKAYLKVKNPKFKCF